MYFGGEIVRLDRGMKGTARKSTTSINHGMFDGNTHHEETNSQWSRVCRTCLTSQPTSRLLSLFLYWAPPWKFRRGPDDQIAKQLCKLTGIEIAESDGYPQQICHGCFDSFKDAYRFFYSVRHHDNKMRSSQLLVETPSLSLSELAESWMRQDHDVGQNMPPYTIHVKEEVLSSEEMEEGDVAQGDAAQVTTEIKIEPEELVMVNGHKSPRSNIVISSSFSMETEQPGNVELIKNTAMVKEELETDEDSDLPLGCLLCQKEFHTISGLKAHVISTHSYKTVTRKKSHSTKSLKSSKERPHNRHKREHDNCSECRNMEGSEKKGLRRCRDRHTSQETNLESAVDDNDTDAKCSKTKTVRQLRREHAEELENPEKRRKSSEEAFKCAICNETFDDKLYLKIHNESCHNLFDTDVPKPKEIRPVDSGRKLNKDIDKNKKAFDKIIPKDCDNLIELLGNYVQTEQNKSSPSKHIPQNYTNEKNDTKLEPAHNNVTIKNNELDNRVIKDVDKEMIHERESNDHEINLNLKLNNKLANVKDEDKDLIDESESKENVN